MSKKRNPNFSSTEIQVLLDEVERNKEVIFCKLSNIVTNAAKKRAWESICEKINSCNSSSHTRTVEEIRKKWSSYTSDAKKKASQQRRESAKTGGGPPPIELDALQDRVVGIIENLPIDGIPGGHDTARSNEGNILSSGIEEEPPASTSSATDTAQIQITHSYDSDSQHSQEKIPGKRKKTRSSEDHEHMSELLQTEKKKVEIALENLEIKRRRLAIEEERLIMDRQRFQMEIQHHQVYLAKHGVSFTFQDNNDLNK